MEKQPIIDFDHVTKEYYLYKSDRARFKALFTNNKGVKKHKALDDVCLKVYRGESVGLIGKNGAGKSTLLKMITGVAYPTEGSVGVDGKVAALLELTAGFTDDMSGRENIYMKGYLLGLNDKQIAEIEENIVEFADLGEYIDQPIRAYSSGMKMRLGFAININIQPDILVVDEALSVGDNEFKKKCKNKIKELISSNITVLYVSHNADSIKEICNRAVYLKKGKVVFDGKVEETLKIYNDDNKPKKK